MKKIISLIICAFILIGSFGVMAADDALTILSGSILSGELDAPVSVLLRYEFSEEIIAPAQDDISILPAVISEIEADGCILTIRLASKMAYNTEHVLDLSKITSVSGKKLSAEESKIKFMTKFGEANDIFEDDFETGLLDTAVWRSGTDAPLQLEGDGGNYCRKAVTGVTFDNFVGATPVYKLGGDFIMEFDILVEKDTFETDYATLLIAGNNGLKSSDENYRRFETKRFLGYDFETGTFGPAYDTTDGSATTTATPVAGKVLKDGWNKIFIQIKRETQSISMSINGEIVADKNGKTEFAFPCASSTGYSPMGDIDATCIRFQSPAATNFSGGANANIYYDNISFREVTAPVFASSSIKNGETVSVSRPKLDIVFRNYADSVEFYLNGEKVSEDEIYKNKNTFTIYPELSWGEEYVISGKALGRFGKETDFELKFKTGEMPEALIETVGFFDSEGNRLVSLESGDITAKVNFWQNKSEKYILLAAVYEVVDGRIKMISISSPVSFASEKTLEEKEITVTVPEKCENCFVEYMVLKDSLTRMPYEEAHYGGSQILK